MSQTATDTAPATTTGKALKPLLLPCPCCGNEEASISVQLAYLDDQTFRCNECEEEFCADYMRSLVAKWSRLLAWLDMVPQDEE